VTSDTGSGRLRLGAHLREHLWMKIAAIVADIAASLRRP